MPIIKVKKRTHPFAMIDCRALNDKRLSWKAKGIIAYLLSKPPDWQVRLADLVKHARDGEESVRTGLDELRRFGYAKFAAIRDAAGRLNGTAWTVYECPDDVTEMAIFPTSVKTDFREPLRSGKTRLTNIDNSTNKDCLLPRICKLFERDNQILSPRESKAWEAIKCNVTEADIRLIERFHRSRSDASKPPYPRQELATLFENFRGELDKAKRIFKSVSQSFPSLAGSRNSDHREAPVCDAKRVSIAAHCRRELNKLREALKPVV
jgi:hypothetical protein